MAVRDTRTTEDAYMEGRDTHTTKEVCTTGGIRKEGVCTARVSVWQKASVWQKVLRRKAAVQWQTRKDKQVRSVLPISKAGNNSGSYGASSNTHLVRTTLSYVEEVCYKQSHHRNGWYR